MTPQFVTSDQIAQTADLTEKHVRRMIAKAQQGEAWNDAHLFVVAGSCGPEVWFGSLPAHIREAFVELDQLDLPLPPHAQSNL